MKYINARDVLPEHLIKTLQGYISGGYIYIPSDAGHRGWGEISGCRRELDERNSRIFREYKKGMSAEELADKYHLSVHAIRKIIYKK